jgi:hypothetical protein
MTRVATRKEPNNGKRKRGRSFYDPDSLILWAHSTYAPRHWEYLELLQRPEYAHLKLFTTFLPVRRNLGWSG